MFGENSMTMPQSAARSTGAAPEFSARDAGFINVSDQGLFNLNHYIRIALKHRFVIIGICLSAIILGAVATLLMTPIYSAETTLQIDRESARVLNVDEVAPRESLVAGEEFFQTQYGLLRSESLAERVNDSLALSRSDAFLEAMGSRLVRREGESSAELNARRRKASLELLKDNLGVTPVRGSRLVIVSFDSPDPQLSAKVANAFAENFIQSNLDRRYESSSYAREFLEERIAQTKARLEEIERQLVAYATDQQIINLTEPGEGDANAGRSLASDSLGSLNAALAEARASRVAAEEKWRQARSAALFSLPEVIQNQAIQRLAEQRAALNATYEQKTAVYLPDYPEMVQLRAQIAELDDQINSIASGIRSGLQGQYVVALNQERSLQAQVDGLKSDVLDLQNRSIQYNILRREADTSRTLYDGLLQRYKEVGVTGGVSTNNISIVDRAQPPADPSKPRLFLNLLIAAFMGVGLGAMAVLLLEALDETLSGPEDVENKLHLPTLGVVPLLPKDKTPAESLADLRSNFSEAYYSILTAIQFSTPQGAPRTLLITSTRPAEGKSTTAYAIALNLSRLNKRVLMIDGDLRNPSMHRLVGLNNERGMSNLLSSGAAVSEVVQQTGENNLHFISCGPLPPNPAELWGGDRARQLLSELQDSYDHVVIDGPPVLGFADSPLLASAVDGTVFVIEAKGTRRGQARGALRRLAQGRAHLLGGVLTKFDLKGVQYGGYDYAYDYHYGATATPAKRSRLKP
jgi:capsular exopolysaccharide synthesis family protein